MRLKQYRIASGHTQLQVAEYLQITRGAYGNFENGRRDPDTETLAKIADFFGVTMDELAGREPPNDKKPARDMDRQVLLSQIDKRFTELPEDLKMEAMAYVAGRIASRKE